MPNTNAAYGLKPVRHLTGGELRTNVYPITAASAAAIYRGDPVQGAADGSIIIAEAGNVDNLGVFYGCEYINATGAKVFSKYWPADTAATNVVAHVYDDPNIVFAIQSDATGVALADIHNGADWEIVAGAAATGRSATNLDVSAGLATTGKSLRILRVVDSPDNSPGAYANVEVIFNEHVLKGVVAGVGGI